MKTETLIIGGVVVAAIALLGGYFVVQHFVPREYVAFAECFGEKKAIF